MEIIVELSLCINFLINAFILKSTALFVKQKARLWWLSAVLGAVVALIYPLFHLNVILKIFLALFLAVLMITISFSYKSFKSFGVIFASFLGVSFVFGGGCYALQSVVGDLPLLIVLAAASVIQIGAVLVLKHRNKALHIDTFSYKVRLKLNDKIIDEEGYLDSGNMLYDPITKQRIVLISYDVFAKIYSGADYMNAFLKRVDTSKLRNGHYVKINTVASGTNILVFDVDSVEIAKDDNYRKLDGVALGLSFSGFEKAFGKNVLLHSEILGG